MNKILISQVVPYIDDYLKKRESPLIYENFDVVLLRKDDLVRFKRKELYEDLVFLIEKETGYVFLSKIQSLKTLTSHCSDIKNKFKCKSVLPNGTIKRLDSQEDFIHALIINNQLLMNSDCDYSDSCYYLVDSNLYNDFPIISFKKMFFFVPKSRPEMKSLILKESSPQILKPASKTDVRLFKSYPFKMDVNKNISHRYSCGFFLAQVNHDVFWQKPSAALFQFKNETFLVSEEDQLPFSTSVSNKAKTIEQAYLSLVPKEARNKKFIKRSELFAIVADNQEEISRKYFEENSVFLSKGKGCISLSNQNGYHFDGEFVTMKNGKIYGRNFQIDDVIDDLNIASMRSLPIVGRKDVWYSFSFANSDMYLR